MWESHSGACTHMCACTAPPHTHRCALPPLSAANPPSLTCGLGSSFCGSTATAPQLLPGLGKENPQRTPQAPRTFMTRAGGQMELVCAAWSHRQGLAAHHCCPERPAPPPQSSPCSLGLSLGPPPSADSTSSEPQALPFLSCSQGTASAPPCTPRAGVRWASWLSPPYEAPLPQAQQNFCRVHAASLSHLCLVL